MVGTYGRHIGPVNSCTASFQILKRLDLRLVSYIVTQQT